NMACAQTSTKIWFVNNATYDPSNSCQSLFIPVETIGKATPGPTATVGVPFTYTLSVPVMYDPATSTYYNQPSANTLSNATIYEDLTALTNASGLPSGVSMTYVSNTAFIVSGASRTPIGPLTLGVTPATMAALEIPASDNTRHLVFSSDFNPSLANIPAGSQVEIQLTVVLDNVPANAVGTSFVNTVKWWFGRFIDGVAYTPLPGQSGVSAPMVIAEPNLTLQKTSTYTNLNVGTAAPFTLSVQNAGGGDAWNATVTDNLPSGMCLNDPTPTVTAQVFASDGVTAVSPPLVQGTDYSLSKSGFGTAGPCSFSLNMLSAAAKIGPTQRLLIKYQTLLDAGTAAGLSFTNVAGATLWYGAQGAGRRQYSRTLTDGTPGTLDFQDAYTLTSATQGYFFLKSVTDLTTGAAVATTVFPGDRLRYTLQLQNFTFPVLNNITVTDDLPPGFVPGSLALASVTPALPPGAVLTLNPTGGVNGTGSLSLTGMTLASNAQYQIQFDATLATGLANGTFVSNQASLTGTDEASVVWGPSLSDNPYVNGPALLSPPPPAAPIPADPTTVQVFAPGALGKATTQGSAAIGELFRYRITVPAAAVSVPLYDVRILDDLGASAADLSFV
ncbi:MAG: DUF11 domain-containing protein, partial [Hylemonella sp.]|nr:DUF11 domain-containing protein [Hylemonella sp.]